MKINLIIQATLILIMRESKAIKRAHHLNFNNLLKKIIVMKYMSLLQA